MIGFIKKLFGSKPEEVATQVVDTATTAANSAPYKVESVANKAVEAVVKSIEPAKKPASKKRYYAKKTPAANKPTTANAPAKKPAPKKSKPAA